MNIEINNSNLANLVKVRNKNIYIFSLGNPGAEYKYTRHNAGRIVCDEIIKARLFEGVKYFEPDTHMNLTGKYIKEKLRYANKENLKIVIVYDDIDLAVGDIKLSFARSSGGHNGVESVIKELGTKDFYRLRIGIGGKPIKEMLLQDYVLSKLKEDEVKILKNLKEKVIEKIKEIALK